MSANLATTRTPLISVVIPAFNCAPYIAQAVRSVFEQDFRDLELILVNDGSPDTTSLESELEPYRDQIRYLKQETRGPSAARNAGIRLSTAKYIAFLDGDDFWQPDHLSRMMRLFESNPSLELTYCDCILLKGDEAVGRYFEVQPQAESVDFDSLLVENCAIATSTVVASRNALLKAGLFDDNLRRCEDFDLWLRMAFKRVSMAYDAGAEVIHRVNEMGLAADPFAMKKDRILVYEKVLATLPVSPEQARVIRKIIAGIRGEFFLEQMKSALAAGDYEAARRFADQTSQFQKNWKVNLTRILMHVSPQLLRRLFLSRARFIGDRAYGSASQREDFASVREGYDRSRRQT